MDLSRFTVKDLKNILAQLNDKTTGTKSELLTRLNNYEFAELQKATESVSSDGQMGQNAEQEDETGVGKLRDDVGALQRSMESLTQQLKTVIQLSTQLQQDNARLSKEIEVEKQKNMQQGSVVSIREPITETNVENVTDVGNSQTTHTSAVSSNLFYMSSPPIQTNANSGMQNSLLLSSHSNNLTANAMSLPLLAPQQVVTNTPKTYSANVHFGENISVSPSSGGVNRGASDLLFFKNSNQIHVSNTTRQTELPSVQNSSIRDLLYVIPDFDPCNGNLSSMQFIDRIEQLKNAYQWSETSVLFAVQCKMKGAAKLWVDAQNVFRSWSDFVSAFISDFPDIVNTADVHRKLMQTRMLKTETTIEFYYKVLSLGRRGMLDDNAIISYVINGLFDDSLRRMLLAATFQKCSDLLNTLNRVCANEGYHVGAPSVAPVFQSHSNPRENAGPICYNCRERGHVSRNCVQTQRRARCEKCLTTTHETKNCPYVNSAPVNTIGNSARYEKETLKEISIKDVKCSALIDSGSCSSLITRKLAYNFVNNIVPCNEKLFGFAGGEFHCREMLSVPITIDGRDYESELMIIDDGVMAYDVIIGTNILSKGRVIIENGQCNVVALDNKKIDIGDQLSADEKYKVIELLNVFAGCFGENLKDLGKCGTVKMSIKLTSNKPIEKKPYAIPFPKQQAVNKITQELLDLNIIRPASSSYASPIVLVRKQNGEERLCVDYRELNAITEKRPWSMPTVEEVLVSMSGKKFFNTLDMMSGYYQIEIEEDCKKYTGFVTRDGHFEFNRMPFGLKNAPSTFQEMMLKLKNKIQAKVSIYVDEIGSASETFEEGLQNLAEFLAVIYNEGLTLRLSKCSFMKDKIKFLGHEIDANGVKPGANKTNAIREYPIPSSATEIRRFLGLTGFFRKFVANYAHIASPLTRLTRKDAEFQWSAECDDAFRKLIQILTEEPVLKMYNVEKEHQVHTDASSIGLAAILLQKENHGEFKPVAYFSRACSESESHYHSYELEVLAVVEACERFRLYILGKHFTIVTDCAAISSLKSTKPLIPRIARWFLKLLEYDYDIIHRPGESMKHVDAMSRAPVEASKESEDVGVCIMNIRTSVDDWLWTMQKQDPKLQQIMDIINGKLHSDQRKKYLSEYLIKGNRLFKMDNEKKLLLVVPRGMRWRVIKMCHDDIGHPGADGTVKRIAQHFWFPRTRNIVKGYIKSCIDCCFSRDPKIKECQLYGMDIPKIPFEVLHMDHLGPFIRSRRGNEHILTIVDALTRYTILVAVKSTKTKAVIEALNQLTLTFGVPKTIITDRGTAFTSAAFEDFCNNNTIQHIKVAVRTPRANGLAERVNQSILAYLKATPTNAKDWDAELRGLQWTLNTRANTTTKYSPIELIYDFPLRDIGGNKLLAALHDDDMETNKPPSVNEKREEAIKNIEAARKIWKIKFDAKHVKPHKYEEGDLVLIESAIPSTGESRKLETKYKGPYVITKVLRFDRYVIEDIEGAQLKQRRYSTIASSDKIKPWCSLFPEIDDDYETDDEDSTQ